MSKKQFKSQASSSRAVSGAFGAPDGASGSTGLGGLSTFGAVSSSTLSYFFEPPDLSGISEPNVVVAFKNLLKKDSTTKSKALEDLHAYVLSLGVERGGVEDAILEAWVGPRGHHLRVSHSNTMLSFRSKSTHVPQLIARDESVNCPI